MSIPRTLEFRGAFLCRQDRYRARDITPPVGIYARMWGCAEHDTAEGIHRPLLATVVSFRQADDGPPLILASLDLGWWPGPEDEWFVRGPVIERMGLESAQLMVHLIHTHSGPSVSLGHHGQPGGELVRPYLETLRRSLGDAVEESLARAGPALLAWTTGRCNLACNRDLPSPGEPRILCGTNPGKPADDTLLVGRITDLSGRPLATLVNYACHPTTLGGGNRLISPDYVGAMRQVVEQATDGTPCLFLLGAAGELGPRRSYESLTDVADLQGRQLGYAALSALAGMLPPGKGYQFAGVQESGAPLALWRETAIEPSPILFGREFGVELSLKDMPLAEELAGQLRDCRDRVQAERIRRRLHLRQSIGSGPRFRLPCWIWRLGDAVLVGIPGEAHSPLQMELRRRFPQQTVVVMNIVNGYYSYLPPAADYAVSSYQVQVSLFEAGCLEVLVGACAQAVGKILQADVASERTPR